jgi:broad specificity phosphatase PhoE
VNLPRLIIVRHGETDWNKDRVFRGRLDIPLNDVGRNQAEATAEALKTIPVSAVVSSPLVRATETAGKIARDHNLEVQIDHRLIDLNYGEWQGLSETEVKKLYPGLYQEWQLRPHVARIPGGETLENVRRRVMALVKDCVEYPGGVVVSVAHRVVNKIMVLSLLGLENSAFWNIRQDTCAINSFDYEPERGFVCVSVNDTCHLRTCPSTKAIDF